MTPYQKYQLEWMLAHDKSLNDLITELDLSLLEETSELFDEQGLPADVSLHSVFNQWQYNEGFGGELWIYENEYAESSESKPNIYATVVGIDLDILNDAIANITNVSDEIKESITPDEYQTIADKAAQLTFNNEFIINPVLETLYQNISTVAETMLKTKQ